MLGTQLVDAEHAFLLCITCLQAISRGMRHRRVGSHELNLESSRSHSIMTIYCDCTPLRADDHEFGTTRYGKVRL